MNKVCISVPATSANMGPGFDCLGMALSIHNTVTFTLCDSPLSINIMGEGADKLSRGTNNLIYRAAARFYQKLGKPVPRLTIDCHNEIPRNRGLGSSSAAIISGIMAANVLCGQPLSQDELLELGMEIEGHPDNITPALMGGCQVVIKENNRLMHCEVPLPADLKVVLFIPDFEKSTKEERAILPQQVTREDAVYNIGRAALLVSSLITNQSKYLRAATNDRLHQLVRQSLFPAMNDIFNAALSVGALGVFLSGSGPTILALSNKNMSQIGDKMKMAAGEKGIIGSVMMIEPCLVGAHVIS